MAGVKIKLRKINERNNNKYSTVEVFVKWMKDYRMENKKVSEDVKTKTFNDIVADNYKYLYRYAYGLTNSEAIAQDVVQETFLITWRCLDSINDPEKRRSWMMTVLKRENLKRVRKEKVNETDSYDTYDNFDSLTHDESDIDFEIEKEIIINTIGTLKEEYQAPLLLQSFYGLTVDEIASKLNLNENTVSTRIFRGKKLLIKKLNQTIKIKQKKDCH